MNERTQGEVRCVGIKVNVINQNASAATLTAKTKLQTPISLRAFQESLGIARNILTDRLRLLTEAGVLDMVPASDGSAYQEYALTPKGEALFPVMLTLRQWGEGNLFAKRGKAFPIDRSDKRKACAKTDIARRRRLAFGAGRCDCEEGHITEIAG